MILQWPISCLPPMIEGTYVELQAAFKGWTVELTVVASTRDTKDVLGTSIAVLGHYGLYGLTGVDISTSCCLG